MEHQSFPMIKQGLPYPSSDHLAETKAGQLCESKLSGPKEQRFRHVRDDINYGHSTKAASRLHEVFLIGVIVCSILTWVTLLQLTAANTHGWGFFLKSGFGLLAYCVPIYLLYAGAIFYKHMKSDFDGFEILALRLLGASTLYLSLDAVFGSGELGGKINQCFFDTSYHLEAWVVTLGFFCAGLFLVTNFSFFEIGSFIRERFSQSVVRRKGGFYPIDHCQPVNRSQHYRDDERESSLITYQQPFSHPHISDPQSNQLVSCLLHFGIRAVVSAKIPGPVITRFELHLAPGTKSSAICSHHKEIARSLCVQEVRVIEVISGKSCIGIDTDNQYYT